MGATRPHNPAARGNCWALLRPGESGAKQRKITGHKYKTSDTTQGATKPLTTDEAVIIPSALLLRCLAAQLRALLPFLAEFAKCL
jgi:hypothetical protein